MQAASLLEFAILGLLRRGPLSGYELRKEFAATPLAHFSDSPGSIYPALRRLQARGWIRPVDGDLGSRNRQRFGVTPGGEREFRCWLTGPVTRDAVMRGMGGILVRFAFMDGAVPRDVTLGFIGSLEAVLQAYVEELEAFAAKAKPGMASSTGWLALEIGVEGYRTNLAWARRAKEQLRKEQR